MVGFKYRPSFLCESIDRTFVVNALSQKIQLMSNSYLRNTLTAISAAYASRYEAVFLCSHPKEPKMSYVAAAKYMGKLKSFVAKWVQQYKKTKNIDDLPERGSIGKVTPNMEKKL